MTSEIRQRTSQSMSPPNLNQNQNRQMRALPGDALAASTLLQSNPTQSGQIYKLDIPFLYSISPTWLQKAYHYIPCLNRSLVPHWKKRYMIQIGKYLYRYQINERNGNWNRNTNTDGNGNTNGNGDVHGKKMKLKGTPLPLQTIQTQRIQQTTRGVLSNHQDEIISFTSSIPSTCHGFFSIISEGSTRYYAVSTPEEANVWINSIRQGRQGCIEQTMGHDRRPYPESWRYIDSVGEERCNRNRRIKDRLEQNGSRELEMMEFMAGSAGSGGSMRSGHFS